MTEYASEMAELSSDVTRCAVRYLDELRDRRVAPDESALPGLAAFAGPRSGQAPCRDAGRGNVLGGTHGVAQCASVPGKFLRVVDQA